MYLIKKKLIYNEYIIIMVNIYFLYLIIFINQESG